MANTFAPSGFSPLRRLDGASWTGNMTPYKISSTSTHSFYKGDPVTMLNTGYIDVVASGTTQITGIFIGIEGQLLSSQAITWQNFYAGTTASADITAYVIDDPWVTFMVQVGTSGAVGGPASQSDVQLNFGFQFGTPSTQSGLSGAYLDYTTHATTSTLPFRLTDLLGFPPLVNGFDTTTAGNFVEVTMNNSNYKSLTGI